MSGVSDETWRLLKEKLVLAALWSKEQNESLRRSARRLLSGYRWSEPVHQIVFELVMKAPLSRRDILKSGLPALLTRRGFPDYDLSWLSTEVSSEQAIASLRELAGQTRHHDRTP